MNRRAKDALEPIVEAEPLPLPEDELPVPKPPKRPE